MRKLFLTTALVAASITSASAQYWVAGSIRLYHSTGETSSTYDSKNKTSYINFSPEIGYSLNEQWDLIGRFDYVHQDSSNDVTSGYHHSNSTNGYDIGIYVRRYLADMEPLRLFVEAGGSYSFRHFSGSDAGPKTLYLSLNPGATLAINDRFGLVTRFGGLNWIQTGSESEGASSSSFLGFSLTNELSLGLYINF